MLQVAGIKVRAGDQRPDVREAQDQPQESGGRGGGGVRDVSLAGYHQGQENEGSKGDSRICNAPEYLKAQLDELYFLHGRAQQ